MRGGSLLALVGAPYSQSNMSTWGSTNYYPLNTNPIIFTNTSFQGGGKRRKRRGARRISKKQTRKTRRRLKRRTRSKRKYGPRVADDIHPYFLRHGGKRNKSRRLRRSRRGIKRRAYQKGGGLFDSRFTTPFPQPITDAYRTVAHGASDVYNGLMGKQLNVNPDPGVQPIGTPQGPSAYDLTPPNVQSAVQSSNNSVAAL
jgi:hypothetical protein